MKYIIETIPHNKQRYNTAGDYVLQDGTLHIYVSDLGDDRYNALVGIHELVESILVIDKGIPIDEIDAFDKQFEADRLNGEHLNNEEPGNALDAPYRRQHKIATFIEHMMAKHLDVDWKEYEEAVDNL